MRLVGREKVFNYDIGDTAIQEWLSAWMSEITESQWSSPSELLEHYPSAQDLGKGVFLFSVGDGGMFLEVLFSFSQKIACILNFKESSER